MQSSHQGLLHVGELPSIHIQLVTGISLPQCPRLVTKLAPILGKTRTLRGSCPAGAHLTAK